MTDKELLALTKLEDTIATYISLTCGDLVPLDTHMTPSDRIHSLIKLIEALS